MKIKLLFLALSISLLSCNNKLNEIDQADINKKAIELKNKDLYFLAKKKKLVTIDSLSEYQFSSMKRFVDSIKKVDIVKYLALKKVVQNDFDKDFDLMDFETYEDLYPRKIKTDEEYKVLAKEFLEKK